MCCVETTIAQIRSTSPTSVQIDEVLVSFNERGLAEAARIREKYPDRIPVIVEKAESSDIPDIDKKNFFGNSKASILLIEFFEGVDDCGIRVKRISTGQS